VPTKELNYLFYGTKKYLHLKIKLVVEGSMEYYIEANACDCCT
jgi:hypothetical protein